MMTCDCWTVQYGVERCIGTKEMECCYCHGDMNKCTFYPGRRKEKAKTMNTAEMWIAAQEDGKTYVSGEICYSAKDGLTYNGDGCYLSSWLSFSTLMALEWHEKIKPTMNRKDAEEKLGVKIVD